MLKNLEKILKQYIFVFRLQVRTHDLPILTTVVLHFLYSICLQNEPHIGFKFMIYIGKRMI